MPTIANARTTPAATTPVAEGPHPAQGHATSSASVAGLSAPAVAESEPQTGRSSPSLRSPRGSSRAGLRSQLCLGRRAAPPVTFFVAAQRGLRPSGPA
ncbi:hypothetical protein STTU_4680 [Streptomyces sp. Tu6071]|nr:hypothetical protein STTU_4680 [Streptomyces sp. Tu6071]